MNTKISAWISDVRQLSEIAKEEPQNAFVAYTHGLCRRWSYVQRTVPEISELFGPLEDVIRDVFIPSLIGRNIQYQQTQKKNLCSFQFVMEALGSEKFRR